MPGPPPNLTRRRRNAPAGGEWRRANAVGWQYGDPPAPPDGLTETSREAWDLWFGGWVAAHWTPGDVPGLLVTIRLFDLVERGEASARLRRELVAWLNSYGLTPKGAQLRRWLPPPPS